MTLSRWFFLAGALPFLVLGAAHALKTPTSPERPNGLSPRNLDLPAAMARSGLMLTRRTNLWLAWVGFNFSHSLGAILFGVVVLLAGRTPEAYAVEARVFVPLALLVSSVYLVLGLRYWFRTPIVGIAISVALFALSLGLLVQGR